MPPFSRSICLFSNRNKYIVDTGALAHSKQSVGIVYLDVNGLKDINDQHGHAYGDEFWRNAPAE